MTGGHGFTAVELCILAGQFVPFEEVEHFQIAPSQGWQVDCIQLGRRAEGPAGRWAGRLANGADGPDGSNRPQMIIPFTRGMRLGRPKPVVLCYTDILYTMEWNNFSRIISQIAAFNHFVNKWKLWNRRCIEKINKNAPHIKYFAPLCHTTAVYSLKLSSNHRRVAAVAAAGLAESGGGVFMTAAKKSLL